jgi:diadenylate cyclase
MIQDLLAIPYVFRIQDIFDILIISVIIYGFLVWFKDAASRFVLVGIALLGAVYYLSRQLQLYLTAVVLQGFFAIILFALVVIFQEELKRFLERIAIWGRIRKKDGLSAYHEDIEIITGVAAELARKHIGAIIVIQGEDPLDRHLGGGSRLDGLLSQALLESIFDPHSAGHDGAVVINRGRVARFGCHLPLSASAEKVGSLGLRHTAALGLAERSDALCVVVSEERGSISVAHRDRIDVLKNAAELTNVIGRHYDEIMPKKKTNPYNRFRKNALEKAAAVVLALTLWFVFGYQRDIVQRDIVLPIEYRNLASDWMVEGQKVTEAKVMLQGPEQAFSLLNTAALKISVDLSGVREGRQEVDLSSDKMKTPSNISVVSITPSRISLVASRLHLMTAPVEVRTEGNLSSGVVLGKIEVNPQKVEVLVPGRLRGSNIRIPTEPIDLKEVTGRDIFYPRLVAPAEVHFEGGKPPTVEVTVRVRLKAATHPRAEGTP